jgi:hypothetical protein
MDGLARVMNKVPVAILRSPLHPPMGNRYLLLSFTRRRSGRRYTTPVACLSEGDAYLMTT